MACGVACHGDAAARGVIALFRTIPDLVWAIFFIIMVGLGPAAGVLAIMVDKIGFAGRFFAEAMEESDPGPQDALRAIGASRLGQICADIEEATKGKPHAGTLDVLMAAFQAEMLAVHAFIDQR